MRGNYKFGYGVLFSIIFMIFLVSTLSAQEDVLENENMTLDLKAKICLKQANQTIFELSEQEFNTGRVLDLHEQAQALYDAQLRRFLTNRDFSGVVSLCVEIRDIKVFAFLAKDEYGALLKFYNETITEEMESPELDLLMDNIQEEIENERYEKVGPLVDQAYDGVIEVRASYGAVEIIKRQTANFFIKLFTRNWEIKLVVLTILIILYSIFRKKIWTAYINMKIRKLEIRRKTLKNLIKKMQRDYFQENNISEGSYNIKTKKFAELIRDIDRQVPLLQEELAKVSKKLAFDFKNKNNEKNKE